MIVETPFQTELCRYPSTNHADSSAVLTNGFITAANFAAREWFGLAGANGFWCVFGGVGADNTTYTANVVCSWPCWGVATGSTAPSVTGYFCAVIGAAVVTLSGAAIVAGTAASNADRTADTVVWTLATNATTIPGFGNPMEAALVSGGSLGYNGATDKAGGLWVPVLGKPPHVAIEFVMGSATTGYAHIGRLP